VAPGPPRRARRSSGRDLQLRSPRAVETVAIAFAGTELPVRADRRLRECDYGQLNGAAVERVAPRSLFITIPFPGGEAGRGLEDLVDAPFAWQPGWLYRMT